MTSDHFDPNTDTIGTETQLPRATIRYMMHKLGSMNKLTVNKKYNTKKLIYIPNISYTT